MFILRLGSLNAMEIGLKRLRYLEKLVGGREVSADTIGRVYGKIETEAIRDILYGIAHKLKRNKALRADGAMRFISIDGHELFSSKSRCCDKCLVRTITMDGKEVKEYYHRVVVAHLVGFDIALPLDAEPIEPAEGEVIAAKRLLKRILKRYPRFFDGIVVDSLYLEAPFINLALSYKKDVVIVLKGERRLLYQDALGVLSLSEPQIIEDGDLEVHLYDMEGFRSLEGVDVPIRVLHSKETRQRRRRVGGKWVVSRDERSWWWATNIPKERLSSYHLWRVGHRRWDIENDCYNDLVNNWHMDHCFHHEPTAIINFLLTLFIAFVLMQSFYKLNMKRQVRCRFTLISIATEFLISLAKVDFIAPWVSLLPIPNT